MVEVSGGEAWYEREEEVQTAWTHFVPYMHAGEQFVLCYQQSTGGAEVLEVMSDLSLRSRGCAAFGHGWSDVSTLRKRRRQRFFCYNSATGETACAHFYRPQRSDIDTYPASGRYGDSAAMWVH
eukprot:gene35056-56797_t